MSTLTILQFSPQVRWHFQGNTATLRIKYSDNFTDSDGQVVLHGLYQEVPCTVADGVLTVPTFSLITTNDARVNRLVTCSAQFFDANGSGRDWLFHDFSIPQSLTPSCEIAALITYNRGNTLISPPNFYLNRDQTAALIASMIAGVGLGPATNIALGIVKLSIAAADPANPTVWGTNDPLVRDALKLLGVTLDALMAAPADGNVIGYDAASTSWKPQATATPSLHAASHQDGGTDEISVAGLSGLLADPQTPLLADDSITNEKLANMATQTIKGRTTAGTGDPEDLTAAQATAILDEMVGDSGTGGMKGLVPAPAAGDAAAGKFLKADGTYAAPSGSGAPSDATYITQTSNGGLSAEQALDALATGIVKVTNGTGVLSTATAGTDYVAPGGALGTPSSGNLTNCTVDGSNLVGFRNLPQNSQSANYTTDADDAGGHVYHPTADDNPRTFTIDSNANVPYPIGTVITFVNDQNTLTIAITDDTLVWAEDGSTGSRTLAENGVATAIKVTATRWIISGVGLS